MRKIFNFIKYIQLVKISESKLIAENIKVDWVYRLYTTVTLSDDDISEIKSYGVEYGQSLLMKYVNKYNTFFRKTGLFEFLIINEVVELNNRQFGISFRYKFLNVAKILTKTMWVSLFVFGGLLAFLITKEIYSIIIGLLVIFFLYVIVKSLK